MMIVLNSWTTIFCVFFKLLLWNTVNSEWVDIPQFSDNEKIYRLSPTSKNYFSKFSGQQSEEQSVHKEVATKMPVGTNNDTKEYNEEFKKEEISTTPSVVQNFSQDKEDQIQQVANDKCYNESIKEGDNDILDYVPLDLFANVHSILKSQPVTTEGKIQFLKGFEKTLQNEIESRLVQAVDTQRKKRGASHHYDHGYDDHDDHSMGFPSIEGALMAISFLTFAVYLVRLVMLLFRNFNTTVPTTTGATLFLGRRKRSTNSFDDEALRILSRVNDFASEFTMKT